MHIIHTRLCFPPHQISAKPMPLGTIGMHSMQDISAPPQPDHNNHNMANASMPQQRSGRLQDTTVSAVLRISCTF